MLSMCGEIRRLKTSPGLSTTSQLRTKRSGDNTTRDTWCNTCVKTQILSNPISLHGEICATLQHPERVKNSPASPVIQ